MTTFERLFQAMLIQFPPPEPSPGPAQVAMSNEYTYAFKWVCDEIDRVREEMGEAKLEASSGPPRAT